MKDDPLNKAVCEHFKKAYKKTFEVLYSNKDHQQTALIKAFYDNLHLVNLYPLIDADFDIEIGNETWLKAIGNYKTYGRRQKISLPSFSTINSLFDPS